MKGNPIGASSYNEKYDNTLEITKYLENEGYIVTENGNAIGKKNKKSLYFYNNYIFPTENKNIITAIDILDAIKENKLFEQWK